jgi:ATP/maltotriose-dependent transcriptional regulator MalT
MYQTHLEKGQTRSLDGTTSYRDRPFPPLSHPAAQAAQQLLTTREHEILSLMAAGMTNPQIAAQLVIGAGTVKTHALNIYRKLEVANRTQASIRAQELGLLRA